MKKEGFLPEQSDIESSKDKQTKSDLKKRLRRALKIAGIVFASAGSAVMVDRGINADDEAKQNADLDKNQTEQVTTIPGDTEQAPDSVQFEVPENPETKTVHINSAEQLNSAEKFRKMQKERPIQEFSNNTKEERYALMNEIIEEAHDWVSQHYSSEEADGLRDVAKEVYAGLIYINSGPIELQHMLAVLVDQFESDRSKTL